MKLSLNKIIGIGLSCLLFIFLASCKNEGKSAMEVGATTSSVNQGRSVDLEDPILADLENPDSLLSVLRPLLLSGPAVRELEVWFDAKGVWEPAFNSSDTLLHCAKVVFRDFKAAGELSAAARVLAAIGRINYAIGNYTVAIEYQQQALGLAQEAKDSMAMGWALGALSSIYFNAKDVETGKGYLFRAIDIGEEIDDPGIRCLGRITLSAYYSLSGKQDSAMIIMKEALRMARDNEFYEVEALGKLNYTFFLISSKKYDEAIAELTGEQSIRADRVSMASCVLNFNLYEAYFGKKDYLNALFSLEKGCVQAEQLDFGFGKSFCEKSWSQYYEMEGDYKAAFKAFKKFHEVDKKQFGAEKQKELQVLKTQQTINEKDREIERLQQIEVKRQRTYLNRLYWGVGVFGILGGSFAFIYFRNRIKMAEQKKVIAETKLQVLQSQMKPHFIYNAMAGIQNYVLRSEKMEAYNYLGKFAALLRIITRTSTETHIELDREIDLIKTYLQLEKMRFREAFVYKVEVADSLLNINSEIPSMMIQPIIENAIIHGISGMERQGELIVSLTPYEDGLKCEVRDNGRGRVAANKISQREGNIHLSIASINSEERLEFLRSLGYNSARIEVLDHYENDEATGTSVCIYLPFRAENNLL
ncbi:tetratricopeptide repeat-containing sensor histidine kinase [Neolewinella persica]|uniref:tetratricopeptide repeat-containing sensor histidine kinase n=1 Tax=Neolewinella persica TaxID=70998 RepID=UPI00035DC6B4|nr:histidine kinase [Neolewinella persica]